ncbi:MAG: nucleotidyltransferase family protein [Chloroflexi bacterium]|uniref:Nucleotidyltransferase family protein n=1 Tax=Candidatus Chlorohelix allophototropha TaxID=3003348 RepID=A0A8T7M9D8_9CHLR|nr:nucleotidyltransferase family protein [Chloroflexota bacterium]WJW68660.1 nucleotidyltransferase family protein [Chloroflexota bacterium L227-S17]
MEQVSAVVLAAGAARRYGKPKQLERYPADGATLLERAVSLALLSGAGEVIVVLGNAGLEALEILNNYIRPPDTKNVLLQIAYNPRWAEGQGFSVATGVEALDPQSRGALFLLADQPRVKPETARNLIAHFLNLPDSANKIIFPTFNRKRGNPALFGRGFFPELAALQGDSGGREVVKAHPQAVIELAVDDPGIHEDIDTPEDLARL